MDVSTVLFPHLFMYLHEYLQTSRKCYGLRGFYIIQAWRIATKQPAHSAQSQEIFQMKTPQIHLFLKKNETVRTKAIWWKFLFSPKMWNVIWGKKTNANKIRIKNFEKAEDFKLSIQSVIFFSCNISYLYHRNERFSLILIHIIQS